MRARACEFVGGGVWEPESIQNMVDPSTDHASPFAIVALATAFDPIPEWRRTRIRFSSHSKTHARAKSKPAWQCANLDWSGVPPLEHPETGTALDALRQRTRTGLRHAPHPKPALQNPVQARYDCATSAQHCLLCAALNFVYCLAGKSVRDEIKTRRRQHILLGQQMQMELTCRHS